MDLIIDNEFQKLIPTLSSNEYQTLEENIMKDGCKDPLVLWSGILVDGHNRYTICTKHNLKFNVVEKPFNSRNDVYIWIIQNQLGRRNLPHFARAELGVKLKHFFQEKGLENKKNAGKLHCISDMNSVKELSQNSAKPILHSGTKRDAREEVAKLSGVSHDTISKVEKILEIASPEEIEKARAGEVSVNQIYSTIKRKEKEEQRNQHVNENIEKIRNGKPMNEIDGLFQTIVIDPPWDWGDENDINQFGRAKPDYATIPLENLLKYPVAKFADENCHLYLWITNRSLPKGFELIEAWGFRYITCLTWVKSSVGIGNYFRGSTEQVLFAIKGNMPLKRHDVGTYFEAPRGENIVRNQIKFMTLLKLVVMHLT
jgi:transcriptional regulator with XRE-family HTH domain